MAFEAHKLHVFFFPFMAYGHIIPLVDIARQFVARGVKVTIITTPSNAPVISPAIERDMHSGLEISIHVIQFPSLEVGLPVGCENLSSVPSPQLVLNFFKAVALLQQPFEQLVEEQHPDAIISDALLLWTNEVASKHKIPRISYHGTSFLALCVPENIQRHTPHRVVNSDSEIFVVPGLPHPIEMTKSQLPSHILVHTPITDMYKQQDEVDLKSFGVIVNSFLEAEPAYVEYYREDMKRKVWQIGPVSLYKHNKMDKAHRGKKTSIDEDYYLKWLESKGPNSVIYVSFGTMCSFGNAQLLEIAMGLEASQVPFIWVVGVSEERLKEFLPEGFEERLKGRGMIVRDWAPQLLILDHPAVGGFMNHAGWNSVLESISMGIPMITMPMFADHFYNEILVTQVLKIGIRAGSAVWTLWFESEKIYVTREKIGKTVSQLMANGEETQDMRRRAKDLGELAKKAVEDGGSSVNSLNALINDLGAYKMQSRMVEGP